jgi:hypothetical protein
MALTHQRGTPAPRRDLPPRPFTEEGVLHDLQTQRYLPLRLAANALTVAESLRDNYFKNTTRFVTDLRKAINRPDPIMAVHTVSDAEWASLQGEVVTFIDGGVGQVQFSSQVPILLRVGSYSVRTGERHLSERERFGYYPVILGDLEGGSKERKDFVDIVRITAELLGGLSALERTPDLRLLMFHGPLVYLVGAYAGHSPFTEADIDRFLQHYAPDPSLGQALKADFLRQAAAEIYPAMVPHVPRRADEWARRHLFEPLAWMAFLYRRLIERARQRTPAPVICGVVERDTSRAFLETILLERVFRKLREKGKTDYFNRLYGRTDLTSSKALLDRLGYTDALLLAMLLQPGQYSEPWPISKYHGLRRGQIALPGGSFSTTADWSVLRPPSPVGFPAVRACYLHVSEITEPIRIEVFEALGPDQLAEACRRTYLYARLLPGYGFPVGLDVADKYAHVPGWLTDAYAKLIRYHLGVSLQRGEISDAEMRRIIVQAIYMTHRDWLFRPQT